MQDAYQLYIYRLKYFIYSIELPNLATMSKIVYGCHTVFKSIKNTFLTGFQKETNLYSLKIEIYI